MIGVDTNVLLRLYVNDDERQHEAARNWFAQRTPSDPAHICLIVLLEFIWSLRRTYGYPQSAIDDLLSALLASHDIVIEQAEVVAEALEHARSGRGSLQDMVIALTNRASGCVATVTFDKVAARKIPAMELLA